MNYSDDPSPISKAEQVWWLVTAAPLTGAGWMLAVTEMTRGTPLALEVFKGAPDDQKLWEVLSELLRAAEERGQSPQAMQLEPEWMGRALSQHLRTVGVTVRASAPTQSSQRGGPDDDEANIRARSGSGKAEGLPQLFKSTEVSSRAARAFFLAARRFYEAAPWEELDEGEVIAIHVDAGEQRGYITLLGQADLETGLIIYSTWQDVLHVRQVIAPLAEPPEAGLLALTFETAESLSAADRAAIRRHRWPVAGPHAYPLPRRITPHRMQPPDREALFLLEAALSTLPAFIQGELSAILDGDENETLAEYEVETSRGTVHVTLTYPAEAEAAWELDPTLPENERQALKLAHTAWQSSDEAERARLAQAALALSPNVIEAYLTLAEEAEYPQEALAWLEKAVQAGKPGIVQQHDAAQGDETRALEEAGLWVHRSARPYLRALQAQAETLEQLGRGAAALEVYQELLRLNPPDHAGARYPALALLLRLNRAAEAAAIIERYAEDESPDWAFARALLAFRSTGDSAAARLAVNQAARRYPQVVRFLTGTEPLLADPNEAGSQAEADAAAYALRAYPIWWSTPGAIEWLRRLP